MAMVANVAVSGALPLLIWFAKANGLQGYGPAGTVWLLGLAWIGSFIIASCCALPGWEWRGGAAVVAVVALSLSWALFFGGLAAWWIALAWMAAFNRPAQALRSTGRGVGSTAGSAGELLQQG